MKVIPNRIMFSYVKTIKRHRSVAYDAFLDSMHYYFNRHNWRYVTKQEVIMTEQENCAYELFNDALPFYHKTREDYPAMLKLRLALNHYGSVWEACHDIANNYIQDPKTKHEVINRLRHEESFGGV